MPLQTYAYPTAAGFRELERELLPDLMSNSPAFKHFPIRERPTSKVLFRQKDNYTGMQQIRGINGEPPRVVPLGENWFEAVSGVYGEYQPIDEKSLTERTDVVMGAIGLPMPTQDMVDEAQEQLLVRRLTRIEWLVWQVMVYGFFQVRDIKGAVVHTDAYTQLQYTASTAWSTAATSTPLADFRAVQLLGRGTSANFGAGATAYVNRVQANRMQANTNAADLGGKKGNGGGTITGLNGWNTILEGEGVPRVEVYDGGYLDETTGAYTLYIPDGVAIVVGTRPGNVTPGEYQMTINANNPNRAPGPYTTVADSADGPHPIPREIHVHDGHSGGPALSYPGMIIKMNI